MAATDQNYRNQYGLDIVFAVSSILMLASTVWMLVDDYRREYKTEQRLFRDVEMAMAQREALRKIPSYDAIKSASAEVENARNIKANNKDKIKEFDNNINDLLPQRDKADLELANLRSDLDSKSSFYNIEVEHHGPDSQRAKMLKTEILDLQNQIVSAKDVAEKHVQDIKYFQGLRDGFERPLTESIGKLKKLLDDFDRQIALAVKKKWGPGDIIRSIPVIDGFAAPTRIDQITLNDLTINYNFKGVTRFDRCTTCHLGIAKPTYTRENLEDLWYELGKDDQKRLEEAHKILKERKELLQGLPEGSKVPDPSQLRIAALSHEKLTQARITEFCAHPRQDLFVGPNSKHPAEKFGCTSCHSGQPSATSFSYAAHTPNDYKALQDWKKEHHWEHQEMWDFPMLPKRFVESSCLKCHHEVTDLFSDGAKSEAPKLTHGYDLIREYGCFGCHEINGYKGGRKVGPDLRLEPNPPLDKLTPAEKAKLYGDPDNPPGTMRKIGPSLVRLSEKTNEEWVAKWLLGPREFRPDTRMPHYYNLSNNDAAALKDSGQEKFPAAEIRGIVQYLFHSSNDYLRKLDEAHSAERINHLEGVVKRLQGRVNNNVPLSPAESKELQDAKATLALQHSPPRLDAAALSLKGNATLGRDIFTKKGCLACHSHAATNSDGTDFPAAPSEANFGPNLTQLKQKLVGADGKTDKATIWLINWLKNPTIHSPRTQMPITHLTDQEAADIAAWLLSQNIPVENGKIAEDLQGPNWATAKVDQPTEDDLKNLATVYLVRVLAEYEIKQLFEGKLDANRAKDLGIDERELADQIAKLKTKKDADSRDTLLHFVGKKAVGRLGCFGCHEVPGFDNAKLIGTPLADWGIKDPTRLAFQDIANYVNKHYDFKTNVVDKRVDEDGYPKSVKNGPLYERFFYDALMHKTREGYLYQKLLEPRSFDYNRFPMPWDDRSRMPQFKFAKIKMKPAEDPKAFSERKLWAEAMGNPLDNGAKQRPPESVDDFRARKDKEEADNREAVMTFVLGLVADPIPLQYLPQPGPDRLAEIKGRQVLDQFNCAGCHVLRPGTYDFKLTPSGQRVLEELNAKARRDALDLDKYYLAAAALGGPAPAAYYARGVTVKDFRDDHFFAEHRAWFQPAQSGDIATAFGVRPRLLATNKKPSINFDLSQALRLGSNGNGKTPLEFRAKDVMKLSPSDLLWPPPAAFQSTDAFRAWDREHGAHGGAFAALLGSYLHDEHPEKNKYLEPGPAVPPPLIWQGERTQPDWLFQFLLDPSKVREQTVLRMPKFSLSQDDARKLADYFAAVEKRVNPDVNLVNPYPKIPQRADLSTDYWKAKTATYIDNLKKAGQYQKEVDALKTVWEKMIEGWKQEASGAEVAAKAATEVVDKLKKAEAAAKDDAEKAALKKKVEDATLVADFWTTEQRRLDTLAKTKSVKSLEADWQQTEAYALAGFRLVVNQCNKCHVVGNLQAQTPDTQGPNLNLAPNRLRPDWAERWIANPQRFLPYVSAMPAYFKRMEDTPLVPWVPGTHTQQIDAARDTVLNLQNIMESELTRAWMKHGAK